MGRVPFGMDPVEVRADQIILANTVEYGRLDDSRMASPRKAIHADPGRAA